MTDLLLCSTIPDIRAKLVSADLAPCFLLDLFGATGRNTGAAIDPLPDKSLGDAN